MLNRDAIPDNAARSEPNLAYDTVAAADYLGCTPGYLKKLRNTDGGPVFHRLFKRKGIIYRREDLDLWQATRRYGSTSEYPEALR